MHFKDNVEPGEKWAFDQEVTNVFPDMLARSIPQLDTLRGAVTRLGIDCYQKSGATSLVDMGCSRGDALAPIVEGLGVLGFTRAYGLEVSEPMLRVATERFAHDGRIVIAKHDLRNLRDARSPESTFWNNAHPSVVLSIFTLQFVPIEHRLRILRTVCASMAPRGVLVLAEKVLGSGAEIDDQLVAMHEDLKRSNGYTDEQIARKRLSLEGVLVPMTADWNADMLKRSGFRDVDCFWRNLNFAAWIAMKP